MKKNSWKHIKSCEFWFYIHTTRESEGETWKIWFEIHSQLNGNKRTIFISSTQYSPGVTNIPDDKILTLYKNSQKVIVIRKT